MAKKTILVLSATNELGPITTTTHDLRSYGDRSVSPDGKVTIPPPRVSLKLKEAHSVKQVSVDRDADGNMYITLEE
jgi:hypothetical protein